MFFSSKYLCFTNQSGRSIATVLKSSFFASGIFFLFATYLPLPIHSCTDMPAILKPFFFAPFVFDLEIQIAGTEGWFLLNPPTLLFFQVLLYFSRFCSFRCILQVKEQVLLFWFLHPKVFLSLFLLC